MFLKDQENATLTVTGTYKNGIPVPDNILEKVKWIGKSYNLYTYSSEPRGKSITIINYDAENGSVPMAFSSIGYEGNLFSSNNVKDTETLPNIEPFNPIKTLEPIDRFPCEIPSIRMPNPIPRIEDSPWSTGNKNEIAYAQQKTLNQTLDLKSVEETITPIINTEFKYNLNGNLIAKIVNSELIESYSYNEFNQLISYSNKTTGKNFTYDYYANG